MDILKKKIVFHYYLSSDKSLDRTCYKIHDFCLRRYLKFFDDVVFVISIDNDIEDAEIYKIKDMVLSSCKSSANITLQVVENKPFYREAETFFREIVDKKEEYEGIIFFGHNKGTTNAYDENIFTWITCLYFFNLEPIDEVENTFYKSAALAYGGPTLNYKDYENAPVLSKYHFHFSVGTFFWVNIKRLKHICSLKGIKIPGLVDRWSAENFISDLFDIEEYGGTLLDTYGKNMLFKIPWFYNVAASSIEILYSRTPLWNKYVEFNNEIKTQIK